jgi:hypothetical protein
MTFTTTLVESDALWKRKTIFPQGLDNPKGLSTLSTRLRLFFINKQKYQNRKEDIWMCYQNSQSEYLQHQNTRLGAFKRGHFYFAQKGTFLFCVDTQNILIDTGKMYDKLDMYKKDS